MVHLRDSTAKYSLFIVRFAHELILSDVFSISEKYAGPILLFFRDWPSIKSVSFIETHKKCYTLKIGEQSL